MNDAKWLILELEKLSTLSRIFHYGPIRTTSNALSRLLNNDINDYLIEYLERIDQLILKLDLEGYQIKIPRYELGEIYNKSRVRILDSDEKLNLFKSIVDYVYLLINEVIKVSIDYAYDKEVTDFKNVNSLNTFINIRSKNDIFKETQTIIKNFSKFINDFPNTFLASLVYSKNINVTHEVIINYTNRIERDTLNYIKRKYSVDSNKTFSIFGN